MTNNARRGRPTNYTPEIGNVVYRLMSQGLSLTAAASDGHRQRDRSQLDEALP